MPIKLDLVPIALTRGAIGSYTLPSNTTQDVHAGFAGGTFPVGTSVVVVRATVGTVNFRHKGTGSIIASLSAGDDSLYFRLSGQVATENLELSSNLTGTAHVIALG